MQPEQGLSAGRAHNLDLAPADRRRCSRSARAETTEAAAQRFGRGFLGRVSRRERWQTAIGVGKLTIGPDTAQEPIAPSGDGKRDAVDLDGVYAVIEH